jgi:universal bacterial protein YeaZ
MSLHNDNALVVALDTSTDMLACAASWIDGQTGETKLVSGDHMCRRHANVELVNTVDGVLAQAGLDRSDVGCYVVGRGPGSFTGVRIGISTAKGLARGANVPLLGVSTLDACAWTAWKAGVRGKLGILADAMRGEVYPALYMLVDEGPERQFEREHVVNAAVALDEWRQAADWGQVQLTGDGLVRYGKLLGEDEAAAACSATCGCPTGEGLLLAHASG